MNLVLNMPLRMLYYNRILIDNFKEVKVGRFDVKVPYKRGLGGVYEALRRYRSAYESLSSFFDSYDVTVLTRLGSWTPILEARRDYTMRVTVLTPVEDTKVTNIQARDGVPRTLLSRLFPVNKTGRFISSDARRVRIALGSEIYVIHSLNEGYRQWLKERGMLLLWEK